MTSSFVRGSLLAALALTACSDPPKRACGVCEGYGDPVLAGTIATTAVNELSGIAASKRYEDVYYVQDDDPVDVDGVKVSLHAIDGAGKLLANYSLGGARVGNLEDIGVGPCADRGTCIFTGDVGNNSGDQSPYPMYRIREPDLDLGGDDDEGGEPAGPTTSVLEGFDTVWLEYPDGAPRDCEGFAVHPRSGDIYIIEKKAGSHAAVFKVPPWPAVVDADGDGEPDQPTLTMTYVGELGLVPAGDDPQDELVVGADIHPCEDKLLVRTYGHVYEYTLPPGAPFDDIFAQTPVQLKNPGGSESIGYLDDGMGYLSVPEGANPPLTVVHCLPPPEVDAGE